MISQLPEIPTIFLGVTYGVLGLVVAITLIAKLSHGPNVSTALYSVKILVLHLDLCKFPQLDAFPAVGSSTWIGSWWAGFKYLTDAQNIIQQGYNKAGPVRWVVVAC